MTRGRSDCAQENEIDYQRNAKTQLLIKKPLTQSRNIYPIEIAKIKRPGAKLFIQPKTGERTVSTKFMRKMVKKYAALAGIKKKVIPYLFRKSPGTELSMKNLGLAHLQLGHKTPKTTLQKLFHSK